MAAGTYSGTGNSNVSFAGKLVTAASLAGAPATTIDLQAAGYAFSLSNGENGSAILSGEPSLAVTL